MLNKSSTGLTTYNEWFISAIKSSKIDGEVQEKKLLQHCLSCCSQVKSLIDSKELHPLLKYEEFRLNSTVLLFLACPTVNSCPQISSSEDLIPLIKSVPVIEDEKLFIVLKGLKNYRYLRGILPWLPAKILTQLLSQFLKQSKSTTPLVLAFSFEIIFALTHSLQLEREEVDSLEECLEAYTAFLKSIEVGFDSEQNCKLRAYHFLYVIESLYLLVCLMCKKEIEAGSTVSLGIKVKMLRSSINKEMPSIFDPAIQKGTRGVLCICNEVVQLITSDIWIAWHDIKSPTFGLSFASGTQKEPDDGSKSIQMQVSHTVFRILKSLEQIEESENPLSLTCYKELETVFKHFAADPDYDPDVDLTNSQLIESINDIDNARTKKLLTILLEREDIFELEDCLKSVRQFGGVIPKPIIIPFINRVIDKLVCGENILGGWKRVVIELCRKLPSENLLHIMKEKLDSGKQDCLKTSEFAFDLTQIFNQLSDQSNNDCYDSFVWLCLQSGIEVVKSSVDMALSLPGMAPVIAPRLRTVHFICQIKDEEGVSLLTKLLMEKVEENMSPENEREFLSLVLKLLEKLPNRDEEARPASEMPLDIPEMLKLIIQPRLNWKEESNSPLLLSLEVLKTIAECYPTTILKSGPRLSSMFVSLSLIYHNCCQLTVTNVALNLKIRNFIECVLKKLLHQILKKDADYAKEISLMKVILAQYDLHPRCLSLLSPLIAPVTHVDASPADQIFSLILKSDPCAIPTCSRTEWIWVMYLVLPDCDEEEWTVSMRLTHAYLESNGEGCSDLVMATLRFFRVVLLLLCDSVSQLSKDRSSRSFISLAHCFKCFSAAAMDFVSEHSKAYEKTFSTLCGVFHWWCTTQRMFDCDTELPCIFLNLLCNALNDLVRAEKVVIRSVSSRRKPPPPPSPEDDTSSRNSTNGEDMPITNNGSVVNGLDTCQVNGSDDFPIKGGVKDPISNSHPNYELLTQDRFEQIMSDLVSVFLSSVPQSTMASTIAAKLKALCELG